ncbi:LCP family protein [Candidatus Gottesmanbacteria bacterium]|nr:LCP family protein [Candidatus Gottesmanbacteria bacterium]
MQPKVKRIFIPRLTKVVFFVALFLLFLGITKAVLWGQSFMVATGLTPMTLTKLLVNTGVDLKSQDGRTNILLLGIGGGTHAGADLTDTILVLSLDKKKNTTAMISVPRDLWSDTLKDKVNSAHHYGEVKKKGGGLTLAKVIVEDMVGLPIHYVLLIDFSGFESIIDIVGGIDVTVPNAFTDPEFPVAGKEEDLCDGDAKFACRYETVTFNQGPQHMDGEQALTYVRSRHAEGDEGSDFARGRREQEVLVALTQKLKNPWTWVSPSRAMALFGAFDRATTTDMRIGELATVGKVMLRSAEAEPKRISFVDFLLEPPLWMYGRYTLVPKESFEAIHEYIRTQLEE